MKNNPFIMMPYTYRKQPNHRMRMKPCCQNPMNTLANGMVTFGSIAVLGGTTVGILNAFHG